MRSAGQLTGPTAAPVMPDPSRDFPTPTKHVTIGWIPSTELDSAARIWGALERHVGRGGLACSWAWTGTWLAHYGDLVPHRFAVGRVGGAPIGIALVTRGLGQKRGPFSLRTIHLGTAGEPLGTGVFVEYNRILVDPDSRERFAEALTRELRDEPGWDELVLDGFAPEDAEPFLRPAAGFKAHRAVCPSTDLRAAHETGGDVLQTLRPSTRRKVRRGVRGLGAVATEWAETPEHGLDILDELISLHQQRWRRQAQPGAFASPRFVAFHRELVRRLIPQQAAFLFRVREAGKTVACLYHFIEQRRVLFYQSGLRPYSDAEIRPGFVAFGLCMQECFERGLWEYNFLAGDARYKRELSTGHHELVWATWRRPTLRGRVIDAAARLKTWTDATRQAGDA
jgi:CelD/BcsL family acetyltransferase involved in cellulose biosynthesis